MKRIIRRYANRKMYDVQDGRSITLIGIAHLLRQGVRIQVIDHPTGLDITNLTLSKVLAAQEKSSSSSPEGSFIVEELIRQRGHHLLRIAERSLRTSMEAISAAESRLRDMVRDMVRFQQFDHREGQKYLRRGLNKLAEHKAILREQLEKILGRSIS